MKIALITGVNGQDGSYLSEFLLQKGYTVIGLVRRTASSQSEKLKNIKNILNNSSFILESGDITDYSCIHYLVEKYRPNEIYNLAAQSHVGMSFSSPISTGDINFLGVLNILEVIKNSDRKIKFYQASTSEMFGDNLNCPQNENTRFSPVSPYACSKLASHHMVSTYRKSYNLFACSGILFNHESPRRGEEFVTKKITKAAARIKLGLEKEIRLGNISAHRDWGYAGDYIKAMWLMLQHNEPDDYVICTGETHSVREFLNYIFEYAKLDLEKYLIIDPKFYRPCEVPKLWGDFSKAKRILGWEPETNFKELAIMMFEEDYSFEKEKYENNTNRDL